MDIQHTASPEPGKDWPRNWNEFLDWFDTDEACLSHLQKLRPMTCDCTRDMSKLKDRGASSLLPVIGFP